jgi:hypothetical protein
MNKSDWKLFDGWDHSSSGFPLLGDDWIVFDDFEKSLDSYSEYQWDEIRKLHDNWKRSLSEKGGDPLFENWSDFRPLSLAREEAWSDWLAYLISKSKTGCFSRSLLKIPKFRLMDYIGPQKTEREVVYEGHRADIVIKWKNSAFTHIEVKTGDQNLAKTYGTAGKMRKKYGSEAESWSDFILLLNRQVEDWESLGNERKPDVVMRTWADVAIGLRRSLLFSHEDVAWLMLARTMLGSVEQNLLGFPFMGEGKKTVPGRGVLDTLSKVLKESQNEEF